MGAGLGDGGQSDWRAMLQRGKVQDGDSACKRLCALQLRQQRLFKVCAQSQLLLCLAQGLNN